MRTTWMAALAAIILGAGPGCDLMDAEEMASIGSDEQAASAPPGDGEDWSTDPNKFDGDYDSLTAVLADVEQPACTAAMGDDCGRPGHPEEGINIPILRCGVKRQCGGNYRVRCKLFNLICLTSQSNGGCTNHYDDDTYCIQKKAQFSVGNTVYATFNYRTYTFSLKAGQVVDMSTCSAQGGSAIGDTFLRLFFGTSEVVLNDDSCGLGSRIIYTAPATGSYTLRMGCYSDHSCEGEVAVDISGEGVSGGELGRISTWSGKVNTHRAPGGAWDTDFDCVSTADQDLLRYCRKFFPTTASVSETPLSSKPGPVWYDTGCGALSGGDGEMEYTCDAGPQLGRIAYWFGKVNLHAQPGGGWERDDDCVSGANIDPLAYCRKFWPSTSSVSPVEVTGKPAPRWWSRNCRGIAEPGNGQLEYICNP